MPVDEPHEYAVWTAEWRGGMATDVSGRGHSVRVDEPEEFGGGDTGPMPTEMLVVALASCFCIAVAWGARKKRIPLDDLRVHVRPHRQVGEPRHGAYDLWVESSTPQATLAPAVELAKRYCWVTNTITDPPELRYHHGPPMG
ncbi:OsmC family protein [Miltoncostaea marina]|uniref:OsmC family protein n=1 Tax=Miltoncostaea marina TaxID=2843215 RepID=UPI001C3D89F1|nr:OsmC family protein [Miltoncostaea marina]